MAARERLAEICGAVGLLGCLGLLAGNVAGVLVVERHDPIADTISDLAAGRSAWILDAGLTLFAVGLLALGLGVLARIGGLPAGKTAAALLGAAAVVVAVIALHDEYGDNDSGKYVIHMELVYAFAVLFMAIAAFCAMGFRHIRRRWGNATAAVAVVWLATAPAYFFTPDTWHGAYERGLGVIVLGWTASLAWIVARGASGRPARGR